MTRSLSDFLKRALGRQNFRQMLKYRQMVEEEESRNKAREEAEKAKKAERIREFEYQQALYRYQKDRRWLGW